MPHNRLGPDAVSRTLRATIVLLVVSLQPMPAVLLASSPPLPTFWFTSIIQGCEAVLATPGTRWDGHETEPMTWAGVRFVLEPIAGSLVAVCVASGPEHLLPASNRFGCLLVGDLLATVDGQLACGAFQSLSRVGDAEVRWHTQVSDAVSRVQPLHWNGHEFEASEPFLECRDGTRTDEQLACLVR